MTINSLLTTSFLLSLLLSSVIQAREFHNTEGKSIEAKLISVEGDVAVMKLTNGRKVKVAMNKLSTADQDHIKAWWKENKNLITERDVKFKIRQKRAYTKKPQTNYSGNSKIKTSESEVTFLCELDNYSTKTISGIKAIYSVHKRVSKRGKEGTSSEVEILDDTIELDLLESRKKLNFTTKGVKCSDRATSPHSGDGKSNAKIDRSSHRETIIGMVLTLSVDGKEILTQCHPENFIRLLKEEEVREDRKSEADSKREEQIEIEADKRDNSGEGRRGREDAERAKRKREDAEKVANRKAKEEEARKKK
jgi:hypothetical protein